MNKKKERKWIPLKDKNTCLPYKNTLVTQIFKWIHLERSSVTQGIKASCSLCPDHQWKKNIMPFLTYVLWLTVILAKTVI